MTSMERAAMAMMATMASATSTIVTPRSRGRQGNCWIPGMAGSFIPFSVFVHRYGRGRNRVGQTLAGAQEARHPTEAPLVGVPNADASANDCGLRSRVLRRTRHRRQGGASFGEIIAPVDDNGQPSVRPGGRTAVSVGRKRPRQATGGAG